MSSGDQTVALPKAVIEQAKLLTGERNARTAVRRVIEQAAAGPGARALQSFEALRADTRRKHPNGMTQAQIRALIERARDARRHAQVDK